MEIFCNWIFTSTFVVISIRGKRKIWLLFYIRNRKRCLGFFFGSFLYLWNCYFLIISQIITIPRFLLLFWRMIFFTLLLIFIILFLHLLITFIFNWRSLKEICNFFRIFVSLLKISQNRNILDNILFNKLFNFIKDFKNNSFPDKNLSFIGC